MPKSTKPKRTRRSAEDRRDEIIIAAKKRFAIAGFEGTTTRQIADDMGVAQSLLLYHFKNKDELWKAVMRQIFDRAFEIGKEEAAKAETIDPRSQLVAGIRGFVRVCQEEPDLHRLMTLEGRCRTDRLEWLAKNYLKPAHKRSVTLIEQCQKTGQVQAGDPTLLYYSIIGIAGTMFSFEPEIALLSPETTPPDPGAVEDRILATLFVGS
ncbi:TetR/AcrR family transcriptional regulator [Parasphingorhabdus sp.]|uniref:TetR/AcrR family transcriptional regulator n=1 Tax=Parasphingorhabdus sp. TaxID=2709688 RepID=UPI003D266377